MHEVVERAHAGLGRRATAANQPAADDRQSRCVPASTVMADILGGVTSSPASL
jgi:hypothetical protein